MKYIHTSCGGVVFERHVPFRSGDVFSSFGITINGVRPEYGSAAVCATCGQPIHSGYPGPRDVIEYDGIKLSPSD